MNMPQSLESVWQQSVFYDNVDSKIKTTLHFEKTLSSDRIYKFTIFMKSKVNKIK